MSHRITNHPVHGVHAGVFTTSSRNRIDLYKPAPEHITVEDIAGALSKICRFGGHVKRFYSVAQHSCLVASLVHPAVMLEGLLHDAAEAYVGDVIKPLKVLLGVAYKEIESRFDGAIIEKFALFHSDDIKGLIKQADMEAVELEHEAFKIGNLKPLTKALRFHRLPDDFRRPWQPDEAEQRFLVLYDTFKRATR